MLLKSLFNGLCVQFYFQSRFPEEGIWEKGGKGKLTGRFRFSQNPKRSLCVILSFSSIFPSPFSEIEISQNPLPSMSTPKKREPLYPIIPVLFPSHIFEQSQTPITPSSIETLAELLKSGKALNANLPEQTEEILEQLCDPLLRKVEIRHMKKTSYTYHSIPRKVRESISIKCPTSLGTACGIGSYGLIRIYLLDEDYESAAKWGMGKGDVVLDARTRLKSPLAHRSSSKNSQDDDTDESCSSEGSSGNACTGGAVGFILPVESHCLADSMMNALSDFIQISRLCLSSTVAVSRRVTSNRAGGLEPCPRWRGVVVSPEIRESLRGPSGWIYRTLEEKWGVQLVVEDSPFCPEAVEESGLLLVSSIRW
jgi:hypothetical protein